MSGQQASQAKPQARGRLAKYQLVVEDMLRDGKSPSEIESYIREAELADSQRGSLLLFALANEGAAVASSPGL
jgi:hypothetical protein